MQTRKPINILVTYIKQPGMSGFRALVEKCLTQLSDISIGFEECHIADVLDTAQKLVQEGCKILLCTGATAEYLQKKLNIDIYTIRAEGFDILEAITVVKQQHKIALLSSQTQTTLHLDQQIFALDLQQFSYDSYLSAKKVVQKIQQLGYQAVIGSPVAVELALLAGLQAELSIRHASLMAVMQQALQRLEKLQQEQQRLVQLTALINHLQDGICFVSLQGVVQFCNTALLKTCALTYEEVLQQPIQQLFHELHFNTKPPQHDATQIITYHNKRFAVLSKALEPLQGYLFILQEVAQIERTTREFRKTSANFSTHFCFDDILTKDQNFKKNILLAKAYAKTESTILITGESGTGKEMLAQSIHAYSTRRHAAFVALNCASFPENLLESELFGYEEGAFTGARKAGKTGLIETAHQGTLFLDEIGDMPLTLQTRLLRVLQEKQVQRLGATSSHRIDIRVIAATHKNLEHCVLTGEFRADLYYRLNILRLYVPALKERPSDIVLLAENLLHKKQYTYQNLPLFIRKALEKHQWHGNIRELENVLERIYILITLGQDNNFIQQQLPELFATCENTKRVSSLKQSKQKTEKALIQETLTAMNGNMELTAQQLNISRTTLWRKLKQNDA